VSHGHVGVRWPAAMQNPRWFAVGTVPSQPHTLVKIQVDFFHICSHRKILCYWQSEFRNYKCVIKEFDQILTVRLRFLRTVTSICTVSTHMSRTCAGRLYLLTVLKAELWLFHTHNVQAWVLWDYTRSADGLAICWFMKVEAPVRVLLMIVWMWRHVSLNEGELFVSGVVGVVVS
jgi:hypothetical protein